MLPAAALAGVPATSGALAKAAAKQRLATFPDWLGLGLAQWISVSSVLTTLLLLRFLGLIGKQRAPTAAAQPRESRALVARVVASIATPWLWAWQQQPDAVAYVWSIGASWEALWPVAVGVAAAWVVHRRAGGRLPVIPEGDLVVVLERGAGVLQRLWQHAHAKRWRPARRYRWLPLRALAVADRRRSNVADAGVLLLLGGLMLAWAAWP